MGKISDPKKKIANHFAFNPFLLFVFIQVTSGNTKIA